MDYLDTKWFDLFLQNTISLTFDGDKEYRNIQKQKFLANEIENPILDYSRIDLEAALFRHKYLSDLVKDILKDENNDLVKNVYLQKIQASIDEVNLYIAGKKNNMKAFSDLSEKNYGIPNQDIFSHLIKVLDSKIEKSLQSSNLHEISAASVLKNILSPIDRQNSNIEYPTQAQFEGIKIKTLIELNSLLAINIEDKFYNAEEIKLIFEKSLAAVDANDWLVEINYNTQLDIMNISQANKRISVPSIKRVNGKRLTQLIVHELGVHVSRRVNGEKQKLKLLGIGLAHYEKAERG